VNSYKMTRREMLRLAALGTAGMVLSACAPKTETATDEPAPPAPEKVTLVLDFGDSTPGEPGVPDGATPKQAGEDWLDSHPNVDIEWYAQDIADEEAWLTARMTARDAPDVWWLNADELWSHINKGWVLDISEWLKEPNPYMPGKRPWESYLQEVGLFSQIGPDGKSYGVNLDGCGVLIVCNMDAMADAGVSETPRTWGEYKSAWQKLKDKGYIPYATDLAPEGPLEWFWGHIINQLVWDDIFDYDDSGDGMISAFEMVAHTQKGDWPLWDAFLGTAQFIKQMEPYLPAGYLGTIDAATLWRQGEAAMMWEGNWSIGELESDPPPFEFEWLAFPVITKDLWPSAPEKVIRTQGAWGTLQWHVTGYLPEMAPEKLPLIKDFLMFCTQPKYIDPICNYFGTLSMVEGSVADETVAPFLEPYDRHVAYESWLALSDTAYTAQCLLVGEYVSGGLSDDELLTQAQEAWAAEVELVLEDNPDWRIG
jgi:ABC-type glycerol-3-phosphate transport system substrate-binding protein